jgi:hypothetical protein
MDENNKNDKTQSSKQADQIHPDEKVCYNCKHFLWLVGVGMGARCAINREDGLPKMLPSRRYTCELFDKK